MDERFALIQAARGTGIWHIYPLEYQFGPRSWMNPLCGSRIRYSGTVRFEPTGDESMCGTCVTKYERITSREV